MDTGDIIDTVRTEIGEYETFGQLYDRLKVLGAKLLVESFRRIERGEDVYKRQSQWRITEAGWSRRWLRSCKTIPLMRPEF